MSLSVVPTTPTASPTTGPVDVLPTTGSRREARAVALERLSGRGEPASPAVVVEPFGPGAAVVALGGAFDRTALEVLRGVGEELDRRAGAELVIDLSRTTHCDDAVARVVARWRIRRLAEGAVVELHGAPPALRAELGHHATPF